MKAWNAGKPYQRQVRPFGFLLSHFAGTGLWVDAPEPMEVDPGRRGRPPKEHKPKPVSPFGLDHSVAVEGAFCREIGKGVGVEELKTYAETLAQFHLSTEDKFECGSYTDTGKTQRRYAHIDSVGIIGKEANKVAESGVADPASPASLRF